MRTLIILGHPGQNSLCHSIATEYEKGAAEKGAEVEIIKLCDLKFNLNLKSSANKSQNLEQDLVYAQELISKSDKLVFIYPVWWGGMPALMKGFIDRSFTKGFAYQLEENDEISPLLINKNARLILTCSEKHFWMHFNYFHPAVTMMKKSVLNFCGIDSIDVTSFTGLKDIEQRRVEEILYSSYRLGLNDH